MKLACRVPTGSLSGANWNLNTQQSRLLSLFSCIFPLAGIAGGVATYYMTRTPILRYALKVVVTSTTIVVHKVPVVDASAALATTA